MSVKEENKKVQIEDLVYCVLENRFDVLNNRGTYIKREDIPAFIMKYGIECDITITTILDTFITNTYGIFLDKVAPKYRDEIMPVLVKYQTGELEVPDKIEEFNSDDFGSEADEDYLF